MFAIIMDNQTWPFDAICTHLLWVFIHASSPLNLKLIVIVCNYVCQELNIIVNMNFEFHVNTS
jgi:hypothetical protein